MALNDISAILPSFSSARINSRAKVFPRLRSPKGRRKASQMGLHSSHVILPARVNHSVGCETASSCILVRRLSHRARDVKGVISIVVEVRSGRQARRWGFASPRAGKLLGLVDEPHWLRSYNCRQSQKHQVSDGKRQTADGTVYAEANRIEKAKLQCKSWTGGHGGDVPIGMWIGV